MTAGTAIKSIQLCGQTVSQSPQPVQPVVMKYPPASTFIFPNVKENRSIGVSIARSPEELTKALEECLSFGSPVVLEQYITGREIQMGYLVDRALPSIEIIPSDGFYDYANKYQPGVAKEITPAPISPALEARLARDTRTIFETLGLSVYSRADFIVDQEETPWFLEINTLPGMTPTSLVPQEAAVAGISYEELCEIIVNASLEARKQG